ncbi:MAG: carbonic anhydrase [Bradymonadia bacterium]
MSEVKVSAADALEELKAGNTRYVEDRREHPNSDLARLAQLVNGQAPFAIVLACSDSRVVPELIFDRGLGDLFVIRVAGNISDNDAVLGSIEYAAALLGVNLVVVLGHQSCGAVTAAVDGKATDLHIDELVRAIAPAVEIARTQEGDLIDNAIRCNANYVADHLRTTGPVLGDLVRDRGMQVVSAYYRLDTGAVEFL